MCERFRARLGANLGEGGAEDSGDSTAQVGEGKARWSGNLSTGEPPSCLL